MYLLYIQKQKKKDNIEIIHTIPAVMSKDKEKLEQLLPQYSTEMKWNEQNERTIEFIHEIQEV